MCLRQIKNIVVVCDYGYIEGGAARIAHETALGLKINGYRVIFFCAVGPVSKELTDCGIEVYCLNQQDILHEKNRMAAVLRGIWNKAATIRFADLLHTLNPKDTIIHVHTWTKGLSSAVFAVAKQRNFRVIVTVHDYFLLCPNGGLFNYPASSICELQPMSIKCITCNCDSRGYPQKLFRILRQWKQNHVIQKCDNLAFAFISEFSKIEFERRYGKIAEEKVYHLDNMVHFDNNRERIECETNNVFLFIGGIIEAKGIRIFCEAVTQANVKAVVIGQGMLENELKVKYPNISFLGWKNKHEIQNQLEMARCLIFPSICYETFGLTPLETMAYGIPVICSNLNTAQSFIDDGVNGWLYDGASVQALANVINRVKTDDIKAVSKSAFESFESDRYSSDRYIENAVKIYENWLTR